MTYVNFKLELNNFRKFLFARDVKDNVNRAKFRRYPNGKTQI